MAYAEQLLQPVFIQEEKKFEQEVKKMPNNYGYEG